jgi:hypothetical protein
MGDVWPGIVTKYSPKQKGDATPSAEITGTTTLMEYPGRSLIALGKQPVAPILLAQGAGDGACRRSSTSFPSWSRSARPTLRVNCSLWVAITSVIPSSRLSL